MISRMDNKPVSVIAAFALRCPLLALRVIRRDASFWSLTAHSGHWPVLALNASVVNDPNLRRGLKFCLADPGEAESHSECLAFRSRPLHALSFVLHLARLGSTVPFRARSRINLLAMKSNTKATF